MSSVVSELYDELAADYERTRAPRFRPFVKRLLQLYDTRPGSHVLDAGCGTGLAATMVAPRVGHGGRVLGIDLSEKMLEIARAKAHGYGFSQCEFAQGLIYPLDAPDASFDLVISSFALWGEPHDVFREFRRALRPHGALLVQHSEAQESPMGQAFDTILREYVTQSPNARLTALREYASRERAEWQVLRSPQDLETALRQAGFSNADARVVALPIHFSNARDLIEFLNTGIRARAERAALDENTRAALDASLCGEFASFETPEGFDVEWKAIQVVARV